MPYEHRSELSKMCEEGFLRKILGMEVKNEDTTTRLAGSGGPLIYRYIPEGSGGTYTFTKDSAFYIGTSKCETCVGVYFAIDDKRCFTAHINVDTTTKAGHSFRDINNSTATAIRNEVVRRLNAEQTSSQWGSVSDRMRNSLVMVCRILSSGWHDMVGKAVSDAVQQWLQITDPRPPRTCGGFIVRHPDGEAQFFDIEASNRFWHKRDEVKTRAWGMLLQRVEQD
ncbi:hypothetical protein LTR36_006812 [Oleoguttula mirabilis]|uniref:Uncharacterized protein n=1 Tax=Oleoguttula mirabilis TaxID=1507867 RepID=A0AAV9JBG7_9PEZI|nr:hypothetical protein LTR36_006812 [Oleoguttula mirabilis]